MKERGEWQYLAFSQAAVKEDLPGVMGAIEQRLAQAGARRS